MQDSSPVYAYIPILVYFLAAAALPFAVVAAARLVAKQLERRPTRELHDSGVLPTSAARGRFSARSYVVATLVVTFEVVTLFLLPWAISLERLALLGLLEMLLFNAIVLVGFFYAWRKGAFESA